MEIEDIYQFSSLDKKSLDLIKKLTSKKQYKKGNIVFYEGESGDNITILSSGLLRMYKTDSKGNEITIHLFAEPTMVAEMPIFEGITYPATARFESDGEAIFINFKKFKEILENDSSVAFSLILSLVKKIKFLENNMSNTMGKTATQKVAKFLYENENILMQLKGYTIANAINLTPETFSRELKKLKNEKLISLDKRVITILDKHSLKIKFN